MEYQHKIGNAVDAARLGKLEEWVHEYLLTEGRNEGFSVGLKREPRRFLGPFEVPIALLSRCCGPEEGMKYVVPLKVFEDRVGEIQAAVERGFSFPPLIVNFSSDGFTLNDGNHRHEAFLRTNIRKVSAVIWTTGEKDFQDFQEIYSDRFHKYA